MNNNSNHPRSICWTVFLKIAAMEWMHGYVVCRYNEMEKCEQKWAKAAIAKEENEPDEENNATNATIF